MRRKYLSPEKKLAVFERDKYTCQYCDIHGHECVSRLEIDHIIPVKHGGDNRMSNLVTACHECNEKKRDSVLFPHRMQGKNLAYWRNFVLQNENMYMDYLVELAEMLGTSVSYLVGETNNPLPQYAGNSPDMSSTIGESLDAPVDDSPITLQDIPPAKKSNGYAYWGGVLDEAQRVAAGRNLKEISLIMPLLKLAYETLASAQEHEQGETSSRVSSVSAYNGDHSSYTCNSLMVEPA